MHGLDLLSRSAGGHDMTWPRYRRRGWPGLVVACAASVVLSACGGGAQPVKASTPTTSPGPATSGALGRPGGAGPAAAGPAATGMVASVSGSTVEVQNPTIGQVTVRLTPSTTYVQTTSASVTALAVGDCVTAAGLPAGTNASTGPFTARTVTIVLPGSTGCGSAGPNPGSGRGAGSARRRLAVATGSLSSLSPSDMVVQGRRNGVVATTTVMLDASTTFSQVARTTQSAVTVGKCLVASGPSDQTGAVTATAVRISPPGPNGCSARRAGRAGAGGSGQGFPVGGTGA